MPDERNTTGRFGNFKILSQRRRGSVPAIGFPARPHNEVGRPLFHNAPIKSGSAHRASLPILFIGRDTLRVFPNFSAGAHNEVGRPLFHNAPIKSGSARRASLPVLFIGRDTLRMFPTFLDFFLGRKQMKRFDGD